MSDTLTTTRIRETLKGLGRNPGAGRVAELLEELQADPRWGRAHIDLEQRLWRKTGIDPGFKAHMEKVNRVLSSRIWAKTTPKEFNAQWAEMDDEARLALLQKAVDLQAKLYGVESAPIQAKTLGDPGGVVYLRGQYDHKSETLLINSDPERDVWSNGAGVLALALHEGAHGVQHQLIKKLDRGEIADGHPWCDQTRLFRASFRMVELAEKKDVGIRIWNYFVIPTERHGHAVERHIKRSGFAARIARAFSAAPEDMNWLLSSLAKPGPTDVKPPRHAVDRSEVKPPSPRQ